MSLTFVVGVIFLYYGKETYAQVNPQTYQKRKSPDSPGDFGYKVAGRINFRVI